VNERRPGAQPVWRRPRDLVAGANGIALSAVESGDAGASASATCSPAARVRPNAW